MESIQQLLTNVGSSKLDESNALDEIKNELAQGSIKSNDLLTYLHTLNTNQQISDSLFKKLLTLLEVSNAKTIVSHKVSNHGNIQQDTDTDKTQLANTEVITESYPGNFNTDQTRIQDAVSDDKTIVHTVSDITRVADAPNSPPSNGETISTNHDTVLTNHQTISSEHETQREQTQQSNTSSPSNGPVKLKPGSILKDRFILKEVLGSGGMSIVFRALDLRKQEAKNQNPYVAIKVLGDSFKHHPLSLLALERETQKIQSLAHPNIITVYDFDRDGEHIYMTMECLNGQSLDEVIRNNKEGMPFEQALPIIVDMCKALIYAHSKDIIHSDFKPENVFHLENDVTKVLDFGIARAKKLPDRKQADTVFDAGSLSALTPPYASLEMLQDIDPDPRDDIYALGCVSYKLLTGKHPYKNLQADLALKAELQPEKINSLDRKQWQALSNALAFKREDRIETVDTFLDGIKPKKKPIWSYTLAIAVVMAIGLSGYLGTSITEKNAIPKIKLTLEQENKIKNYLEIADLYFSLGYLATPPGDSALDQYEKVLAINPANNVAIEGKKKLVNQYNKLALMKLELNELEDGLQLVETGLLIRSDDEDLLDTRLKIKELQTKLK